MSLVSSLLARGRRNVHLALCVVLAVLLIAGTFNLHNLVSQAIVSATYQPFFIIKTSVSELFRSADERDELRQALVDASVRLSMLEEAARESERLRSVLGFEPAVGFQIVPARVVAVYGYELPVSAVINRGENDSVAVDQSIINRDGLVGRVVSVTPDFATIQLLTDPQNRVAARIDESREMGIVRYQTGEGMVLDNFPVQGNIKIGDGILSSGLGGVYPAGLRVGTVEGVERPEKQPFCRITLSPAVNFHNIEELFVLRSVQP
ncbi:MAG: rod shape-determining protein MreC [candidate division Zixibacteria bacterium]|nr:rod shape-determining protein MreC [candidate division Zixibacteria bacterium]